MWKQLSINCCYFPTYCTVLQNIFFVRILMINWNINSQKGGCDSYCVHSSPWFTYSKSSSPKKPFLKQIWNGSQVWKVQYSLSIHRASQPCRWQFQYLALIIRRGDNKNCIRLLHPKLSRCLLCKAFVLHIKHVQL